MKKTLGFVGGALVVGLASTAVQASDLFGANELANGYQIVAEADAKAMEAKCGADKKAAEAKCGANKAATEAAPAVEGKGAEGKCGEAKCGADKKAK